MAEAFLAAVSLDRWREWASRGLTIRCSSRRSLVRVLAVLDLREERLQDLLSTTQAGLREFPEDDVLHLYRGMALEAAGDQAAAAEYRESLRINPGQPQAEKIRARAERIAAGKGSLRP
jgi:regulator of sirC expression with transglutaminase-like and TPR domain